MPRLTLNRMFMIFGIAVFVCLLMPAGAYFIISLSKAEENLFHERGRILSSALAARIALTDDPEEIRAVLEDSSRNDSDIRYIYLTDRDGVLRASHFEQGEVSEIAKLAGPAAAGEAVHLNMGRSTVVDIPAVIPTGNGGTLHVGLSEDSAGVSLRHSLMLLTVFGMLAVALIGIGIRFSTNLISRPLRNIEKIVSSFSLRNIPPRWPEIHSTQEIESLAAKFREMIDHLYALEQERILAQSRMVHTERLAALGELAGGLTHEIRNPLDGMIECVKYLEAEPEKSPRQAKFLPMIHEGLERINKVMHQMLIFARSGKVLAAETCSTAEIVEILRTTLQGKLEVQRVTLAWQTPGTCKCFCNKQIVLQSLLNLALNSIDAVETVAAPAITVKAWCDEKWVYFSVGDNGPGIPESNREKIFEPFFSTKPSGKGTGLGLSISREMIRATGGELELCTQDKIPGGACFMIRVPRVYEERCSDDGCQS